MPSSTSYVVTGLSVKSRLREKNRFDRLITWLNQLGALILLTLLLEGLAIWWWHRRSGRGPGLRAVLTAPITE